MVRVLSHVLNLNSKAMSNLIINIRFWYWHLQVNRGFKNIRFKRNDNLWCVYGLKGMKWIEIYAFFNL